MQTPLLNAVLYPQRSLGRGGFLVLMGALGGVSLVLGTMCLIVGAWPVFGFYGLDVALVWFAFRQNYRAARIYERIRVTPSELTVEQGAAGRPPRIERFQPAWARVILERLPDDSNRLMLTSHGRSLAIGSFLSPDERAAFADALAEALGRARQPQPG